jgi:phosphoenolpyruvate carboxykinase (GTP)
MDKHNFDLLDSDVAKWVESVALQTKPSKIVVIDGSESESHTIVDGLVSDGTFISLNEKEYPNCYLSRSDVSDVARVEDRTFICSRLQGDSGPTNNWHDPVTMYEKLNKILDGSMVGRTMYVIPYLMGPDNSPYSKVGFEITDSAYVVANMRIMARIGKVALKNLTSQREKISDPLKLATLYVKGVHTVGSLDPQERYIAHFPEDNAIISVNSNYGGNALQGKKCFALRLASIQGRKNGWLAEHMLILSIKSPKGEKKYICAAFPSGCGKTNLAMVIPPKSYLEAGWEIKTVGDDIAWLNYGSDGRLYAINPEYGFFGIAPGTSEKTNPNALAALKSNSIFTNVALNTDDMTPWWEGLSEPPSHLKDWKGNDWTPESGTKAAQPNARFTTPIDQCPCIDPDFDSPRGVPISAIIFGGRRAKTTPLVVEAKSWTHGTFLGVTMASETTAAATGKTGQLRRDPMAMTPFIGYHAGDYFAHWLEMEKLAKDKSLLPKIFHVNWFKTDSDGKFLWPGFSDNVRVLDWVVRRLNGEANAIETPLGLQPHSDDINLKGDDGQDIVSKGVLDELFAIKKDDWGTEIASQAEFFFKIGDRFPKALWDEHNALKSRLNNL